MLGSAAEGLVKGVAAPLFGLIDNLFTSDEERDAAKLKLIAMEQAGELDGMKIQLSAIIAEANSTDPWTSRARPSFLYVMYTFILAAIPMGFLFAFRPEVASDVTEGVKLWLEAMPSDLLVLFGAGYLGYTGARSIDKKNGKAK
jgi:hypothetical protein